MDVRLALLPAAALAAVAFALPAAAESVTLTSGTTYDASEVTVAEGHVRFTFKVGGGTATVTMPWERLDPWSALAIRAARAKPGDGRAQLALGRFALDRGLVKEAERRFRKAAEIDPSLVADRDAALAGVRDAELVAVLDSAAKDLKEGRADVALTKAKGVRSKAAPDSLPYERATSIVDLASSVAERDFARRQAEEAERAAAQAKAVEETLTLAL